MNHDVVLPDLLHFVVFPTFLERSGSQPLKLNLNSWWAWLGAVLVAVFKIGNSKPILKTATKTAPNKAHRLLKFNFQSCDPDSSKNVGQKQRV